MPIVTVSELEELIRQTFVPLGASAHEVRRLQEHLINSHLAGHHSHGIRLLPDYLEMIRQRDIILGVHPEIQKEGPAFAMVDGHWGLGQVVALEAVMIANAKAREHAIAIVTIRNCSHIGRLGEYTQIIAEQGLIGFITVNGHGGAQCVAPWGGIERRLSVNPISFGIPSKPEVIVLDMSPTEVAAGKVVVQQLRGENIPLGWVLDALGNPTSNPEDFNGNPPGSLVPLGGHKGFGLAVVMDIIAGVLSGGGCSRANPPRWGNATTVIAINPDWFVDRDWADHEMTNFVEYLRSSKLRPGVESIMLPGEPESQARRRGLQNGIFIDDETWRMVRQIANY